MTPALKVRSGEVELAVYRWGAPASVTRATVVLVHGYPDSAQVWRRTAEALAPHCHVVAYDVRGAGASSAPRATSAYRIDLLVGDFGAVIDAVSPDRPVHLVAHDWGSIALWEAVTTDRLRGRIASFTTMSGPSFDHAAFWMRKRLRNGSPGPVLRQLGRSWYFALFQVPGIATLPWHTGLDRRWPAYLRRTEGIVAEPSPTQRKDGCNGVKLYRANFFARQLAPRPRHTGLPVQLILATRDRYMVREIFDDLPQWAPRLTRREIDAGHWAQLSHPVEVASLVAEFIATCAT